MKKRLFNIMLFSFLMISLCSSCSSEGSGAPDSIIQQEVESDITNEICYTCGFSYDPIRYEMCPNCICEECGRIINGLSCEACEREQGFTTIQSALLQIKSGNEERYRTVDACALEFYSFMASDYDISVTNQSDDYLPTLRKSEGDELIVTQSFSKIEVYPVIGDFYCYPAEFVGADSVWGLNFVRPYLDVPNLDNEQIVELNGVDVLNNCSDEEVNAILEDAGCFLLETYPNSWSKNEKFFVSKHPTTLLMGYWEGVDWREITIDMSGYKLYEFGSCIELPVEKTKLGYFIVDTSQIPAGTYAIRTNYSFIAAGPGEGGLQLFCIEE